MAEQSRTEEILRATIDGDEYAKTPQSREEELLIELKQTIEAGGGASVVPNPEGEATETLTKLGVNDTVYGIPKELPTVTSADAGNVLTVSDQGEWEKAAASSGAIIITGEYDSEYDITSQYLDGVRVSKLSMNYNQINSALNDNGYGSCYLLLKNKHNNKTATRLCLRLMGKDNTPKFIFTAAFTMMYSTQWYIYTITLDISSSSSAPYLYIKRVLIS